MTSMILYTSIIGKRRPVMLLYNIYPYYYMDRQTTEDDDDDDDDDEERGRGSTDTQQQQKNDSYSLLERQGHS